MGEGTEEILFYTMKSWACQRAIIQPIYDMEADNWIGGSKKEGNLPVLQLGKNNHITADNMDIHNFIGITFDDNNDPIH